MAEKSWFMKALEIFDKMTDDEKEAKTILMEVEDTFPRDFFRKKSVDELNEWFGANTDIKVTENVRKYMDYMLRDDDEWDEVFKFYDDLPETDEGETEEKEEEKEDSREDADDTEDDDYEDLIEQGFFAVKPLTKNEFIEKYGYDFEMREDEKPGLIRNVNESKNSAFKKRSIEYYRDDCGIDPKDIGIKV